MAVVRFSGELRTEIATNAKTPFLQRHTRLVDSLPLTYGPVMYEKALGCYMTIMQQMPDNFFHRKNELVLDKIRVIGHSDVGIMHLPRRMTFPLAGMLPFPLDGKCGNRMQVSVERYGGAGTYVAHADDLQDAEFIEMIRSWLKQLEELAMQREEFVKSVKQVTNTFTTLAPALKAWPPLWDLLPESVRKKHRTVVDKRKRDPAESLTVDLDKMTSVVTINKLMR